MKSLDILLVFQYILMFVTLIAALFGIKGEALYFIGGSSLLFGMLTLLSLFIDKHRVS